MSAMSVKTSTSILNILNLTTRVVYWPTGGMFRGLQKLSLEEKFQGTTDYTAP